MRVIGYPSCNLATLEEAMGVIKGLAEGGEVDYNGTRQTFPWCDGGSLPMWMAAYGPKALALCGRKADGFILQLADPQIAAWTIGAVRRAAEEGVTVPELLRREAAKLAARPSIAEWLRRTGRRPSEVTTEQVLRNLDEWRGEWPDAGR